MSDPAVLTAPRRPRHLRLLGTVDATRSDAELVEACRQTDPIAWRQLVERHDRRLHWVARRQGVDDAGADDAVQQAWASLYSSLDRVEHPEAIGAWLGTTVRRNAIRISKQQRRPVVELLPPAEASADELLIADEAAAAVRRAVARLSPSARQLVELLFSSDELSYAEISRRIGRSPGSIGPTRGRQLDRLRELFEEELGQTDSHRRPPPDAA
jgi:RNA polymerase sigma factor (sigma-70 family)